MTLNNMNHIDTELKLCHLLLYTIATHWRMSLSCVVTYTHRMFFRPSRVMLIMRFSILCSNRVKFDHPVYVCFVDLEKAYDRVPWGILGDTEGVWGTGDIAMSHLAFV